MAARFATGLLQFSTWQKKLAGRKAENCERLQKALCGRAALTRAADEAADEAREAILGAIRDAGLESVADISVEGSSDGSVRLILRAK